MALNDNERDLKKVGKTDDIEEKDTKGKLKSNFYIPSESEYQDRAKDIKNPAKRKQVQQQKGLLEKNPGVKTQEGRDYVRKLEEATGEDQSQIGTFTEAPGGGTPLARGTKAPSDEWVKEHRQMQPRDPETGQFEYNNANAKGVKYASRGKKALTFIKGGDFDDMLKKNEHIIITDENKTAISRLDMTENEFKEAIINFSQKNGFTTRWATESKKGRKSKRELEALENQERGRIGKRVDSDKSYGPERVSQYDTQKNDIFDKSYTSDLTPAQERAIASIDSDPDKFKKDLQAMLDTKAYQERNKRQEKERADARHQIDVGLNDSWKNGFVDDAMVQAVKDVYPGLEEKAQKAGKDVKDVVKRLMGVKKPDGSNRFKNFEDFRHWAIGTFGGK